MECSEVDKITECRAEYLRLKVNPDYRDVEFNETTGALKATHIGHNFDRKGGRYEKQVQNAGFKTGHAVIFGDERLSSGPGPKPEGHWDGKPFEVAGCETCTSNNILRSLKHCASKRIAKVAILVFPKGGLDIDTFNRSIARYKGLEKLGDGQFVNFNKVICVQGEEIVYDEDLGE